MLLGSNRYQNGIVVFIGSSCTVKRYFFPFMEGRAAYTGYPDRKFLFLLPNQKGTSLRLDVLVRVPDRPARHHEFLAPAHRRFRRPFAVTLLTVGGESTRNPRARLHLDGDLGGGSNSFRWGASVFSRIAKRDSNRRRRRRTGGKARQCGARQPEAAPQRPRARTAEA